MTKINTQQRKRELPSKDRIGTTASRAKFERLGILRWEDLILFFPMRYEDETKIWALDEAPVGELIQVEGVVIDARIQYRPRRQLLAVIEDGSGVAGLRFFNFYPSQQKTLSPGSLIRAVGELRVTRSGQREMAHPRFKKVLKDEQLPTTLTPIYPTTKGLTQATIRKAVAEAFKQVDLGDTMPLDLLQKIGLPTFSETIEALHRPTVLAGGSTLNYRGNCYWQRVKFDELLAHQLIMKKNYAKREKYRAVGFPQGGLLHTSFMKKLDFQLTSAQRRVWSEIENDMSSTVPMRRLLQGDVGSGKTVIAVLAALKAVEAGYQVALMVPTEILSEQHFKKIEYWTSRLKVRVAHLTGSLSSKSRALVLGGVRDGSIQLVVGTHALFQDGVVFDDLGLVIIDEQHRFGVKQRLALTEKRSSPTDHVHHLMMSATPIPRSLAMTFFGDLDVSVIDELPPGRTPISTRLVSNSRRHEVFERVQETCRSGQQVYWVCPLIEESEVLQLETAVETFETVQSQFADLSVGLIHGKMKSSEKANVMNQFVEGEIQLLVATTVIEVGVDVPNATVMVIENAERMGLSQLHQLRGRVGRGSLASTCVLLYDSKLTQIARQRLRVIYENLDGFEVAREDLKLRGPGEVLGARQSGVPMLRYADVEEDVDLVEKARQVAGDLMRHHQHSVEQHIDRWYGSLDSFSEV